MGKWKGRILALAVALVVLVGTVPVFATDGSGAALGQSGGLINPAGIIDITPPVLTSISIDKTVVEAPGTVMVTAEAWDDISGIYSVNAEFYCEEIDRSVWAYARDYDNTGYFKDEIFIDKYQLPGTFELVSITVHDNAGNSQSYAKEWSDADGVLLLPINMAFTVVNHGELDTMPPVLDGMSIDKTIVEAPGAIIVTGSANDDISGVYSINAEFYCKELDSSLWAHLRNEEIWNDATQNWEHTGIFRDSIYIGDYQLPGTFELIYINIHDNAGNTQVYQQGADEIDSVDGVLPLPISLSFEVVNLGTLDKTPPTLNDLSIDKDIVEAPGTISVTGSASDDISGVYGINAEFYCADLNQSMWAHMRGYNQDEDLHDIIYVDVYQLPGTFELVYANVHDNAGNTQYYIKNPDEWDLAYGVLPLPFDLAFTVINDGTFDYASNTNNPNLADEIAALPDGSIVGIDYGSNPHIGADVFEAIQGKDIDVVLIGNGVEWVFNGLDIDNPKPLDLSVGIEPIDYYWDNNSQALRSALSDTPAVVLSFPNNGKLPGEAKMRVKADSEFRQYLGVDDLYVYYFNPYENELQLVEPGVNVSNDGFIEFTIDHNSEFVITSGAVGSNGGGTTPPINPTYPSSGGRSSRSSSGGSSGTYNFDKRDVTASAKVNGNEIEVTGQTQLGFYQATCMGTKIEGVTTRATENGVVVVLPQEFVDSIQNKQWKKVRIEFFNAYVDVDYSIIAGD